ncbi:MAG: serine hydrolase, partial [Candidatus Saccharicenans sp.]
MRKRTVNNLSNRFWLLWIFLCLLPLMIISACHTPESITKSRIKSLEKGLYRAVYFKGQRPEKLRLVDRMSFYKVPGVSMAAMDKYQVEWVRTYGYKEIINYQPITRETVFQVGELSQPVAAALTLILSQEGKLNLEEKLGDYY